MRQPLHVVIGCAFWALLILMWVLLFTQDRASASSIMQSAQIIAVTAAVVLGATLAWIAHNVGIYRRKGPRRAGPERAPRTDVDRLGRPLVWGLPEGHPAAAGEPHLVVELVGGAKVYRRP